MLTVCACVAEGAEGGAEEADQEVRADVGALARGAEEAQGRGEGVPGVSRRRLGGARRIGTGTSTGTGAGERERLHIAHHLMDCIVAAYILQCPRLKSETKLGVFPQDLWWCGR